MRKNPFRRLPCSVIMPHFNVMKWNSWEWIRFLHESPGFTLPMWVAMMIENEGVSQCSKVSKMRLSVFHQKLLSVHRAAQAFNIFQQQSFLRPFTATVWCRLRMCSAAEKLAWRRGGKLITSRCSTLEMWRKRSLKFFHRLFHVKLSRKAFSSFLVESERVVWGCKRDNLFGW